MNKMRRCISFLVLIAILISMAVLPVSAAATYKAAAWNVNAAAVPSSPTSIINLRYTKNVSFDGNTVVKLEQNANGDGTAFSYEGYPLVSLDTNYDYNYLIAECYYDTGENAGKDTFSLQSAIYKMGGTASANWVAQWGLTGGMPVYDSAALPTNQWVTASIDVSAIMAEAKTRGYNGSVTGVVFYPGLRSGDALYIRRAGFYTQVAPQVYMDNEGKYYTYVSENGIITVDGNTIGTYPTVWDAFTALGTNDATVYLEGDLTSFEDVAKGTRGEILFRGLGDSAEDIAANRLNQINAVEIIGGNITFDYLTVVPFPNAEAGTNYTSFYSSQSNCDQIEITFGEHINASNFNMTTGSRKAYNGGTTWVNESDKITINGGKFYSITPLENFGSRIIQRKGTIDYTINGGNINAIFAGSNNSWEWEHSEIDGDVKYTINGGTF